MSAATAGAIAALMVGVFGALLAVLMVRQIVAEDLAMRALEQWRFITAPHQRFAQRLMEAAAAMNYSDLRDVLAASRLRWPPEAGVHLQSLRAAEAETWPWLLRTRFSMDDVRFRVQELWRQAISSPGRNPTTTALYRQARHELETEDHSGLPYDHDQRAVDLGFADDFARARLEMRAARVTCNSIHPLPPCGDPECCWVCPF